MYRYIYTNKKTGRKVYSNEPKHDKDLVLERQVRDTRMKSADVVKK